MDNSKSKGRYRIVGRLAISIALFSTVGSIYGEMIVFEGVDASTVTTGDLLEGVSNVWITNTVQEFSGLEMRARSGSGTQSLNANNDYFGINSDIAGEDSRAFDVGETMFLSFDQSVRIDRIDFNLFDSGETFTVKISGMDAVAIRWDDLSQQNQDYIDFAEGLEVAANVKIEFYASSGSIGIDSMNVEMIPEPAVMSFIGLTGFGLLVGRRLVGV
ncbi:hypothetical protein [Pontiella sulfatireligans]|uniref:PEP-CTERM protein-sorting domain-containing protein n=1 Tax=Pontiella sulfatireligans TaxID=2750658 RepID=A0A6C2UEB2_9BACT|nr:hypothetical protein [Pontiella sulfatireligans]VGO18249.1 hypothetical protein SCARR_00301 [Pontiella sulfatireligans]